MGGFGVAMVAVPDRANPVEAGRGTEAAELRHSDLLVFH